MAVRQPFFYLISNVQKKTAQTDLSITELQHQIEQISTPYNLLALGHGLLHTIKGNRITIRCLDGESAWFFSRVLAIRCRETTAGTTLEYRFRLTRGVHLFDFLAFLILSFFIKETLNLYTLFTISMLLGPAWLMGKKSFRSNLSKEHDIEQQVIGYLANRDHQAQLDDPSTFKDS